MDCKRIQQYTADCMKTVFAFCLTRVGQRAEAEDLASEILCRVLAAAPRICDEDAFYAYLWRIARNVLTDHLRQKHRTPLSLDGTCGDDPDALTAGERFADDTEPPVEERVVDGIVLEENIRLLRRELSLLSEQYRRATVLYYMEHRTCAQIAQILSASTDMVKYYLFRARKMLLEGMKMNRLYGEKSYRPKDFEIDFWGTHGGVDAEYTAFRRRKIKGNILAAAYYSPVTAQELSMELGVALPYLEDELAPLLERRYLKEKNGKYLTNIPIFTEECTAEIDRSLTQVAEETADQLRTVLERIAALPCKTGFPDENALRWQLVTLCCAENLSFGNCDQALTETYDPASPYALVGDHACGIIWGRCICPDIQPCRICGISHNMPASDGRGRITTFNFWQVAQLQSFAAAGKQRISSDILICTALGHFDALSDAHRSQLTETGYAVNGQPNFPVYTRADFAAANAALADAYAVMDTYIRTIRETAAAVTADHAPVHLRGDALKIGPFVYGLRGYECLVDALYERDWLKAPEGTFKPAMYVVEEE